MRILRNILKKIIPKDFLRLLRNFDDRGITAKNFIFKSNENSVIKLDIQEN